MQALKFAGQWTFGTAKNHPYIHGVQGIWERELESNTTTLTGVYLAGYRLNEDWSLLSMSGLRHELGEGAGNSGGERTSWIQNTTLFRQITDQWGLGLETNLALSFTGRSTLLVMPQVQYEPSHHLAIQFGVGFVRSNTDFLPEIGFRVIWTR